MSRTDVSIPMPDGQARAFVFRPSEGKGPWPGALFLMDARRSAPPSSR